MDKINWIQIMAGFLGGGAVGAVIKQFFDNRKYKIQPISQSIELRPFYDSSATPILNSQVILTGDTQEYKFSNLFSGTITITNSGHIDYPTFNFGITAPNDTRFIHLTYETSDRHHIADSSNRPSLENQSLMFDLSVQPFNRKDIYKFHFLATTTQSSIKNINIETSSPHSIKWINPPPMARKSALLLFLSLFTFPPK